MIVYILKSQRFRKEIENMLFSLENAERLDACAWESFKREVAETAISFCTIEATNKRQLQESLTTTLWVLVHAHEDRLEVFLKDIIEVNTQPFDLLVRRNTGALVRSREHPLDRKEKLSKVFRSFQLERSKLNTVADVIHSGVMFYVPHGVRNALECL